MNTIVTDAGFAPDTGIIAFTELPADTDPAQLDAFLPKAALRIPFDSFADGRGFTLARLLRLRGYRGHLRASGHVIADQYAMARRSGFDDVEITPELAERQPQDQWLARANWHQHDYQARMRGTA